MVKVGLQTAHTLYASEFYSKNKALATERQKAALAATRAVYDVSTMDAEAFQRWHTDHKSSWRDETEVYVCSAWLLNWMPDLVRDTEQHPGWLAKRLNWRSLYLNNGAIAIYDPNQRVHDLAVYGEEGVCMNTYLNAAGVDLFHTSVRDSHATTEFLQKANPKQVPRNAREGLRVFRSLRDRDPTASFDVVLGQFRTRVLRQPLNTRWSVEDQVQWWADRGRPEVDLSLRSQCSSRGGGGGDVYKEFLNTDAYTPLGFQPPDPARPRPSICSLSWGSRSWRDFLDEKLAFIGRLRRYVLQPPGSEHETPVGRDEMRYSLVPPLSHLTLTPEPAVENPNALSFVPVSPTEAFSYHKQTVIRIENALNVEEPVVAMHYVNESALSQALYSHCIPGSREFLNHLLQLYTQEQKGNTWLVGRHVRMTATFVPGLNNSNPYNVNEDADLLVSKLWSQFKGNAPTAYGNYYEEYAMRLYQQWLAAQYPESQGYHIHVRTQGVHVDPITPYMAASPDGVVTLFYTPTGSTVPVFLDRWLVEIKCPFSGTYRGLSPDPRHWEEGKTQSVYTGHALVKDGVSTVWKPLTLPNVPVSEGRALPEAFPVHLLHAQHGRTDYALTCDVSKGGKTMVGFNRLLHRVLFPDSQPDLPRVLRPEWGGYPYQPDVVRSYSKHYGHAKADYATYRIQPQYYDQIQWQLAVPVAWKDTQSEGHDGPIHMDVCSHVDFVTLLNWTPYNDLIVQKTKHTAKDGAISYRTRYLPSIPKNFSPETYFMTHDVLHANRTAAITVQTILPNSNRQCRLRQLAHHFYTHKMQTYFQLQANGQLIPGSLVIRDWLSPFWRMYGSNRDPIYTPDCDTLWYTLEGATESISLDSLGAL